MLSKGRVAEALERERDGLVRAAGEAATALEAYGTALQRLQGMERAELIDRLGGTPWPGARPIEDMDAHGVIVPFARQWTSAEEARGWALQRLRGVPTAAVDGSQIPASKEFGVPLSLVQVGWFVNPHDASEPYVKDVRTIVLAPEEGESEADEYAFADSRVNRCRFVAEMEAACEQVRRFAGRPGPPVVFVDGTLVLSFAGRIPAEARAGYLQALFRLLDTSRECRIPVVGYVDSSRASDLVTMLRTAFDPDLQKAPIYDGQVLGRSMGVFERSAAFATARGDILPLYRSESRDYSTELVFVYVQIGPDGSPARLDIPRWVADAGQLDHVVDVVRAEIVVGNGYPYALETADVTALLTVEDRMAFYGMFREFAARSGVPMMTPRKTASKGRRR
jgi:hypothetical protein